MAEQKLIEPLSQNKRLLLITIAIIGTIICPVLCMLFGSLIITNFGMLQSLTIAKSLPAMEYSKLMLATCGMVMSIIVTGFMASISWVMIFIQYNLTKKYANYMSYIAIIGGIIALIGLNVLPSGSFIGCITFSFGEVILIMGILSKMGLLGEIPTVKQPTDKM